MWHDLTSIAQWYPHLFRAFALYTSAPIRNNNAHVDVHASNRKNEAKNNQYGKMNISIPEKVKVILSGNLINIEGPLGKSALNIDLDIFSLDIKDGKEISIKPKKTDQNTKRLWAMNRSLKNNGVI